MSDGTVKFLVQFWCRDARDDMTIGEANFEQRLRSRPNEKPRVAAVHC